MFAKTNLWLAGLFISNLDDIDNKEVRIRYGYLAGWISIIASLVLFVLKITLGLMADSDHFLGHGQACDRKKSFRPWTHGAPGTPHHVDFSFYLRFPIGREFVPSGLETS